jgi:hypothetical protein
LQLLNQVAAPKSDGMLTSLQKTSYATAARRESQGSIGGISLNGLANSSAMS